MYPPLHCAGPLLGEAPRHTPGTFGIQQRLEGRSFAGSHLGLSRGFQQISRASLVPVSNAIQEMAQGGRPTLTAVLAVLALAALWGVPKPPCFGTPPVRVGGTGLPPWHSPRRA